MLLTKCPVFDELGIKDKVHGFLLDFDMNNVPIDEIYKGLPKFKYTPPKDNWDKFLTKEKNNYKEEFSKIVELEVIKDFSLGRFDELIDLKRYNILKDVKGFLYVRDTFKCNKILADELLGDNPKGIPLVKKIGEIK